MWFILYWKTSKPLSKRIYQYRNNVRNTQENSAILYHHHEYNYPVSLKGASEILFVSNFYTRNLLESIIIKINFDIDINLSQGVYNTDKIFKYFIEKELKIRKMFSGII